MNKLNTFLLASLISTTGLFATNNENIDLTLKNYDEIKVLEKMDNILISVKEEGIVRDIKVDAQKWTEVNELLKSLIKRKNYKDAYILFKHIDFDQKIEEYKSYITFFQIINKMESKHSDFLEVENIHDNFLLTHLFSHFFISLEKEKINDISILGKIEEGLIKIENKYYSIPEKQRVRYKIALLRGKYVKALSIIETLSTLTVEDRKYKSNTRKVLLFMQEHFFNNYLNMKHSDFKDYNLLYRTNPTKCDK